MEMINIDLTNAVFLDPFAGGGVISIGESILGTCKKVIDVIYANPPYSKGLFHFKKNESVIYSDFTEVSHQILDENGTCKLPFASFAGYMFEALVVRKTIENKDIKINFYKWLTNGKRKLNEREIQKIQFFGYGFKSTEENYPRYYSPNLNHDIGIIKLNDEGKPQQKLDFDLQVKAITCNEKERIIKPLLKGKYTHVLTLQKNPKKKIHTEESCREILRKEVNEEDYQFFEKLIKSPESLGMDQVEVENYNIALKYFFQLLKKSSKRSWLKPMGEPKMWNVYEHGSRQGLNLLTFC
jgi:hypothetical protein